MSIEDLRKEYKGSVLNAQDLGDDPIDAFRNWFEEARTHELIPEPNAMTVATVNDKGFPSARILLLKEIRDQGFIFYTNYQSRKGEDIMATGKAAVVFWWEPLRRQIRIEGDISKIDEVDSKAYFSSRPRGSQIGAWVSEQSSVIDSREELDSKLDAYIAQFGDEPIPKPPHWGGYIVNPSCIEFWQGGERRLHDRIRFRRNNDAWIVDRLSP